VEVILLLLHRRGGTGGTGGKKKGKIEEREGGKGTNGPVVKNTFTNDEKSSMSSLGGGEKHR
jgi:hypothetical protein